MLAEEQVELIASAGELNGVAGSDFLLPSNLRAYVLFNPRGRQRQCPDIPPASDGRNAVACPSLEGTLTW